MRGSRFRAFSSADADRLRDESRREGQAAWLACPRNEADLAEALREADNRDWPVTLQGARTGITAGAVPSEGAVIDVSGMNQVLDAGVDSESDAWVRVQPGMRLTELRSLLETTPPPALQPAGRWRFAPDPTETSASLGGMVSTNASGALSFSQGAVRAHLHAARVLLPDGDALELRRGIQRASETGRFRLTTESGRQIAGTLPAYRSPDLKNAAGYYSRPGMDLLDAFIGSEGTLGVFADLTLRLQPAPAFCWGILCFLPDEKAALELVETLRATPDHRPAALEYFDADSLNLLRAARESGVNLPALEPHWRTALYVEFEGCREQDLEARLECLTDALNAAGGHDDEAWMGTTATEREPLKTFRHAVPEQVNRCIDLRRKTDPRLTKLGTDLAVPDAHLRDMLARYRRDLAADGFESVIFGHIGDNHLHVNILPRNWADYEAGRRRYADWAKAAIEWGGTVAAEHGIGKLKTALLAAMAGQDGLAEMQRFKALFDPKGRLNPGNLFSERS